MARGFTLLELVVALAIFAVMSTLAYSGLNATLRAREGLSSDSEQWRELQLAVAILDRDLRYISRRAIRDENGEQQDALRGRSTWFELTRAGWANPAGLPRASLQRVHYRWQSGPLQRLTWPVLDRTLGTDSQFEPLLESVERLEFRYLANGQWHDQWPLPGRQGAASDPDHLPEAISVVLAHETLGHIERLYQIPASVAPANGGSR